MMMKCKKQFIALFMAISVIFCVGSESYIKAEALEWAIPTITAGEAIKWLLGLLGVTVAGGALANTDWDNLVEQYNDYAEIKGQTAVETGKFWADIIDGTLDQGSQAWSNFKKWVSSLSFGGTSAFSCTTLLDNLGISNTSAITNDFDVHFGVYGVDNSGHIIQVYLLPDSFINYSISVNDSYFDFHFDTGGNGRSSYYTIKVENNIITRAGLTEMSSGTLGINRGITFACFCLGMGSAETLSAISDKLFLWDNVSDSIFNAYNNSLINKLSFILSNAISDAIPDVIPLPWGQVSDTAEGINEKIDELIEKVNEGVLSLEDYMIAIQSILGVIAFDTTNDLVVPSDPDLPDETIQDKINENVNNNGFVLTGLENFFPFCIPFDIYSFITILVADPVAPVIHWHIYNPVTKTDNIMTLDFAMWEPVVILFRYIFDFLFIIGLALIARSLIGGDD